MFIQICIQAPRSICRNPFSDIRGIFWRLFRTEDLHVAKKPGKISLSITAACGYYIYICCWRTALNARKTGLGTT
jgi:hypothetical protein